MGTRSARSKSPRVAYAAGIGVVFAMVAALTAVRGDWLEAAIHHSPDRGSGATEWWLVALVGLIAIAFWVVAAVEWRRANRLATNLC